jgi:glycosyltransferase involved in cell wall biosynthesis
MVKVSIVIPTHKRPERLKRALESVKLQTYTNIEVLVVNDNWRENEYDVIKVIKDISDDRVFYYRNVRKKGANGARNTGIIKSTGDYVAFLDDDDEYLPFKVECSVKKLEKDFYIGVVTRYSHGFEGEWFEAESLKNEINIRNFLLGKIPLCAGSNLIVQKNIFNQIGLWNENLERHQDLELILRILDKYKLAYINKMLLKIHIGHNNPAPQKSLDIKMKYFIIIEPFIKKLSKNEQNIFFANQYREISLQFGLNKELFGMVKYFKKSLEFKILKPYKYIRFLFVIADIITPINTQKIWKKTKHNSRFFKFSG